MEKTSTEDECVDSGAETGGSDYSPLSSTSSDLSMGELQDPFLVSVHLIADPGEGKILQRAADAILACVHPELQLLRVSERARRPGARQPQDGPGPGQPALALILFLQEASGGGEEELLRRRRALHRPPWRYHHTETVSGGRRLLPRAPCSQDFFTLSPGTPLWALRQVHYGREIVRFTLYCQHQNYGDMVRLYKLLLQRRVAQKKDDFCFLVVYSNPELEIQLSFKRLPPGQRPAVLDAAVMEVRVRDAGALVPLLPHPCSPISELRWRTEDYDGNKILLQVQAPHFKGHKDPFLTGPSSAPPTITRNAAHHRTRRHHHHPHRAAPQLGDQQSSPQHPHGEAEGREWWAEQRRTPWRSHRSGSMFSLPNLGSASFRSTCSSPGPSSSPHHKSRSLHRSNSFVPPCRFNVDALDGAEETDVDTGHRVNPGRGADLSVVSAYLKCSLLDTSKTPSAPAEDPEPSRSPAVPAEDACKAATLGRTVTGSSAVGGTRVPSADLSGAPSLSDVSLNQSDSCSLICATIEEVEKLEEEDQEFYI